MGSYIKLEKKGSDYYGCCPFHDDKTPSLVVTPSKNLFHCFGCGAAGSVIDWVMKIENVSFNHAIDLLKNNYAIDTGSKGKSPSRPRMAMEFATDASDKELLHRVLSYYQRVLKASPEIYDYLEKRGINDPDLIDTFKLGYANRTLTYRIPKKKVKDGERLRGQLQKIGIFRESGHEHLSGSLVIPIFDEQGNIAQMYGRKLRHDLKKGTPRHTYLPGPHQGIWNMEAVKVSEEIILCEAIIDAMSFWANGYRNVTASYGVSGFTPTHLAAFKKYKTKRVLIAYDRDEAGDSAAFKLSEKLIAEGIDCYRINFPKGMDANEYSRQVTPASKSLGVVIRSATWLGNGKPPENETSITENVENEVVPNASPVTPAVKELEAKIEENGIIIELDDRRYRIRGLEKNLSYDQMRVNILASRQENIHVDTLELYSARHRAQFIAQTAKELMEKENIIRKDLSKILLKLEQLQEQQIKEATTPKSKEIKLTDEEVQQAMNFLKDKELLKNILKDFDNCGVTGEEANKLVAYLAATSRKLDKPLGVMVQSSSAAGKSSLMESVLGFMPDEDRIQYSAMTGQSLFYMEDGNLKNKILAIAEEEGAQRASYALKLLQSEGKVSIASTGKDPQTGRLITQEYKVEGPVMIFSTTTSIDPDEELLNRCLILGVDESREQTRAIHQKQREEETLEELLNRCLILGVDESREQTRAIHQKQREEETLEGLLNKKQKDRTIKLHQNAQRLLRPITVVNPFADKLTFIDDKTRTRRDHKKYLTLIRTVALLHQYQRPLKRKVINDIELEYIEVTLEDIETANELTDKVLGKSLDELPPQTRRLLEHIHDEVIQQCELEQLDKSDYRFSRKMVRDWIGWSDFQTRKHMQRLSDMEYLLIHKGGRGQSFVYELLYDGKGKDGSQFINGLIDTTKLVKKQYDTNNEPLKVNNEPSISPQKAPVEHSTSPAQNKAIQGIELESIEIEPKAYIENKTKAGSYLQAGVI